MQALYSDCFKAFFYLCRFFVSSCDFAHASIKSRGDSDNGALHLLYVISFGDCEGLLAPLSVLGDSLWGVRQLYSTKNAQIQECKANWLKQAASWQFNFFCNTRIYHRRCSKTFSKEQACPRGHLRIAHSNYSKAGR